MERYSFFFFSSRRRHTRWPRDWSSDVCSSDLELLISEVIQKAVITVDEEGMEAAAATAAMLDTTSAAADPKELVLDAPFLFVAYETSTRAPLVLGWIGDPAQTR